VWPGKRGGGVQNVPKGGLLHAVEEERQATRTTEAVSEGKKGASPIVCFLIFDLLPSPSPPLPAALFVHWAWGSSLFMKDVHWAWGSSLFMKEKSKRKKQRLRE
jgi:hypothetical protein